MRKVLGPTTFLHWKKKNSEKFLRASSLKKKFWLRKISWSESRMIRDSDPIFNIFWVRKISLTFFGDPSLASIDTSLVSRGPVKPVWPVCDRFRGGHGKKNYCCKWWEMVWNVFKTERTSLTISTYKRSLDARRSPAYAERLHVKICQVVLSGWSETRINWYETRIPKKC